MQRGEAGVDRLPRGGGRRAGRRIAGQRLEPAAGQVFGPARAVVLAVQRAVRVAFGVRVERARRRDPRPPVHPGLVERQDAVEAVDRPRRVGGRPAVVGQAEPRAAADIGGTQDAPLRVARHRPFEVALVQRQRHPQATPLAVRAGGVDRGRLARAGQGRGRATLDVAGREGAHVVVDPLPERVRRADDRRQLAPFADRVDAVAEHERPLLGLARQGGPLGGPLALVVALTDQGVGGVRGRLRHAVRAPRGPALRPPARVGTPHGTRAAYARSRRIRCARAAPVPASGRPAPAAREWSHRWPGRSAARSPDRWTSVHCVSLRWSGVFGVGVFVCGVLDTGTEALAAARKRLRAIAGSGCGRRGSGSPGEAEALRGRSRKRLRPARKRFGRRGSAYGRHGSACGRRGGRGRSGCGRRGSVAGDAEALTAGRKRSRATRKRFRPATGTGATARLRFAVTEGSRLWPVWPTAGRRQPGPPSHRRRRG